MKYDTDDYHNLRDKFDNFVNIVKKVRKECPWDRKQTLFSLKDMLVDEVFEIVEALELKDIEGIKEELGDLFLHVILHSVIAEEDSSFTLEDVLDGIARKIVFRHPHVFGDAVVEGVGDVVENWEKLKRIEKKHDSRFLLDKIAQNMPALEKSYKICDRVSKAGFGWKSADFALDKLRKNFDKLMQVTKNGDSALLEAEIGEVFFALTSVARELNISPSQALNGANRRFCNKFNHLEASLIKAGKTLEISDFEEMEKLWNEADRDI